MTKDQQIQFIKIGKLKINKLNKSNSLNTLFNLFIRNKKEAIIKKAEKLYKIVKSGKQPKLNSRCCDYIMLEKYYNNFELAEVAATE